MPLAVPIVGELVKVHSATLMSVITCNCRPTNRPMLLRGQDLPVVCAECFNVYQISRVRFESTIAPTVDIEVRLVGKAERDAGRN